MGRGGDSQKVIKKILLGLSELDLAQWGYFPPIRPLKQVTHPPHEEPSFAGEKAWAWPAVRCLSCYNWVKAD